MSSCPCARAAGCDVEAVLAGVVEIGRAGASSGCSSSWNPLLKSIVAVAARGELEKDSEVGKEEERAGCGGGAAFRSEFLVPRAPFPSSLSDPGEGEITDCSCTSRCNLSTPGRGSQHASSLAHMSISFRTSRGRGGSAKHIRRKVMTTSNTRRLVQ